MADGRDHGNTALGDGASQVFGIERPQVFDRAAAARHDDHVRPWHGRIAFEALQGIDHLRRRRIALDDDRPDDDAARPTVADAMQDVADDRAGRRGDDADDLWREGQGPLACRIEQTFTVQLLLQPFKLRQKRADAGDLHLLDDDLILRRCRKGG